MARITLLGSNSGRNAGDAAILAAIMGVLSERVEGVSFEVPTTHPGFVSENYGDQFDVKPISIMPWTGSIRLLGIPTFRSIKRTEVTMITDGIIFDVNLFNPLFNFLITLIFLVPWARFWGRKVVCYSVGIGPLRSFWGRRFARYVGNASDLIMVRDEDSRALFREIGVEKEIHLTADAVFANWSASDQRVDEIVTELGLEQAVQDNAVFGVNVTRYVDRWLSADEKVSSKESFLPMFARVLCRLKQEQGLEPVIVTTQVMDAEFGHELARLTAAEFKRVVKQDWKPVVVTNVDYTNHEIQGLLARFRLFVGMRLHSLIISARAGTPVVGLVYAPKVRSFLAQLDTPHYAFELTGLSAESLCDGLAKAWDESHAIFNSQQRVVRELEQRAVDAAELVAKRYFSRGVQGAPRAAA